MYFSSSSLSYNFFSLELGTQVKLAAIKYKRSAQDIVDAFSFSISLQIKTFRKLAAIYILSLRKLQAIIFHQIHYRLIQVVSSIIYGVCTMKQTYGIGKKKLRNRLPAIQNTKIKCYILRNQHPTVQTCSCFSLVFPPPPPYFSSYSHEITGT